METTENHTEGVISMTGIKIPLDASLVQSLLSSETEGIQKLLKQLSMVILTEKTRKMICTMIVNIIRNLTKAKE